MSKLISKHHENGNFSHFELSGVTRMGKYTEDELHLIKEIESLKERNTKLKERVRVLSLSHHAKGHIECAFPFWKDKPCTCGLNELLEKETN